MEHVKCPRCGETSEIFIVPVLRLIDGIRKVVSGYHCRHCSHVWGPGER